MTEDDVKFSVELEAGEEPDEMEEDDRVRSSSSKKTKGRGHGGREDRDDNDVYESLSTGDRTGPQRCKFIPPSLPCLWKRNCLQPWKVG